MQIHGTAHIHAAQPLSPPHRTAAPQPGPQADGMSTVDQLDISREADLMSRVREVPDIRADRVAAIRSQVEAGAYETYDKLDIAVQRLLDEIG